MAVDKITLINEIEKAFSSLTAEEAEAALLLVQARAEALSMTFEDYLGKYHPEGLAKADNALPGVYRGYVKFLGEDARTIIRAGKSANFSTFVHESAHIFRRQLAGELKAKAERAFAVTGGKWTREQEELFAKGLEEYIRTRRERNGEKREVFEKGSAFVQRVYEGMGSIIGLTPEMEAVYEQLFFAAGDENYGKEDDRQIESGAETGFNNFERGDERIYFQTNIGQLMFDYTDEETGHTNSGKQEESEKTTGLDGRLKIFTGNKAFGVSKRTTLFDYTASVNDTPTYYLHMSGETKKLEITKEGYEYLKAEYQKAEKQKDFAGEATEEQKELFHQLLEERENRKEKPEEENQAGNAEKAKSGSEALPEQDKLSNEEAIAGEAGNDREEAPDEEELPGEEPEESTEQEELHGEDSNNIEYEDDSEDEEDGIAPPEFHFEPRQIDERVYDYTGIPANRVFLVSEKDILTKERPSWIPDINEGALAVYRFIPLFEKRGDAYLIRINNQHNNKYLLSLEVFSATIDYYLKRQKARNKEWELEFNVKRKEKAREELKNPGLSDYEREINEQILATNYVRKAKPVRIMSINRMTWDQMNIYTASGKSKRQAFEEYNEVRGMINQKLLDMNAQLKDYQSVYTKGAETSYGDGGTNNALLEQYGVLVKRQNGDVITAAEIADITQAFTGINKVFGDLKGISRKYGLKISHAGMMNMHARKAVGLFHDAYHAIGVSFGDRKDAALVLAHETAHFLDSMAGKETNHFFASDDQHTIESRVAESFRQAMNKDYRVNNSGYLNRTCECFARALEQYTAYRTSPEMYKAYTEEHSYCADGRFRSVMVPLIAELLKEREKLWHIPEETKAAKVEIPEPRQETAEQRQEPKIENAEIANERAEIKSEETGAKPPVQELKQETEKDAELKQKVYQALAHKQGELLKGFTNTPGHPYGISGNVEKYKEWGGKEWTLGDKRRIYFNGARALKNLYGLQVTKSEEMSPGDIVRKRARAGLKYLPLGHKYPVEANVGGTDVIGNYQGDHIRGNMAWRMLTSKPYYDMNKGEFVGLQYPMIETNIGMERAVLEVLKNYRSGAYPDVTPGVDFDDYIQEIEERIARLEQPVTKERRGEAKSGAGGWASGKTGTG